MKKSNQIILSICITACIFLLFLQKTDFLFCLEWYLYLLFMGIISFPVTTILFDTKQHPYLITFSKIVGILITGFMMWITGIIFKIPFTRTNGFIMIVVYALCNVVLLLTKSRKHPTDNIIKESDHSILASRISLTTSAKHNLIDSFQVYMKQEILFLLIFLFWTYLIGFQPAAYGTEKFMDYGFLQKMLVSSKLPPDDIWFSGKNINYYYGGQYYTAFLAKTMLLKQTQAEYAYNLMRACIPALLFTEVFCLIKQIIKKHSNAFALLSAISVTFAGNMHYVIYALIKPFFDISGKSTYWFPDSTRYIGYDPLITNDQTIHEFPCYSFILGDLHAHMINLIFVAMEITLLYILIKKIQESQKIFYPQLILVGGLLGVFNWTNYWDFIIYEVVVSLVVIFADCAYSKKRNILIQIIIINGMCVLIALPFTHYFTSVFQGVGIAQHHSKLYQLCILWGLPFITAITFIWHICNHYKKEKQIKTEDLFVFILTSCAMGLVLIPEFVYVRDIYEQTHARANTMFKLTYQAFLMFQLCSGYIYSKLFETKKNKARIITYLFLILQLLTVGYFFNAANSWFGQWLNPKYRTGLNALSYLDNDDFSEEKKALLWLKGKSESGEYDGIIAEAPGNSYTTYGRVSVITGLSTPAGWKVHEWLWRNSYDDIDQRSKDIDNLYLNADTAVIKKYHINYIFWGKREIEKYGTEKQTKLKTLGTVIYKDANGMAIIKVCE